MSTSISTDRRHGVVAAVFFELPYCDKLDKEDTAVHVSSLIFVMGTDAETVYATFHIDAPATSDDVLAKFDYFFPKVNFIHERAIFSARCQQSGDGVEALCSRSVRTL